MSFFSSILPLGHQRLVLRRFAFGTYKFYVFIFMLFLLCLHISCFNFCSRFWPFFDIDSSFWRKSLFAILVVLYFQLFCDSRFVIVCVCTYVCCCLACVAVLRRLFANFTLTLWAKCFNVFLLFYFKENKHCSVFLVFA